MNKLLLVALLGLVLIALSAGEEENSENSLQALETEVEQAREVREADPKRKKKKNRAERKRKKKNKSKKKKKGKKAAKRGKKKSRSRKKKGKKGKKAAKGGKKKKKGKKGKKGKKNRNKKKKGKGKKKKNRSRKRNKGKKKKKAKKTIALQPRQAGCSDDACLAALAKYMNQYNAKYRNFENQRKRIEKFEKLTGNKGGKKDDFKTIKGQIREAGGGNASALKCGDSSSGTGVNMLKELFDNLTKCSDQIKDACQTQKPAINQTFIDQCKGKMDMFKTEAEKCLKSKDNATAACVCWKSAAMKTASDNIATCDISKLNKEVADFKKNCTQSFAKCRQDEDRGSKLIYGCRPGFKADQLKKLFNGKKNKKSLENLKTKLTEKSTRRIIRAALSCTEFVRQATGLIGFAGNALLAPKISEDADALVANAPTAACDAADKAKLKALLAPLEAVLADLAAAIENLEADIAAITGSKPTDTEIAAAGTTAMPMGTTMKTKRFRFQNMIL